MPCRINVWLLIIYGRSWRWGLLGVVGNYLSVEVMIVPDFVVLGGIALRGLLCREG
jgi:hypothetical protein